MEYTIPQILIILESDNLSSDEKFRLTGRHTNQDINNKLSYLISALRSGLLNNDQIMLAALLGNKDATILADQFKLFGKFERYPVYVNRYIGDILSKLYSEDVLRKWIVKQLRFLIMRSVSTNFESLSDLESYFDFNSLLRDFESGNDDRWRQMASEWIRNFELYAYRDGMDSPMFIDDVDRNTYSILNMLNPYHSVDISEIITLILDRNINMDQFKNDFMPDIFRKHF